MGRASDAARRMHARASELVPEMHRLVSADAPPDMHVTSPASVLAAAVLHSVAEEMERVRLAQEARQRAGVRIVADLVESMEADPDGVTDNDLLREDLVRLWDAFAPGTRALDEEEMGGD